MKWIFRDKSNKKNLFTFLGVSSNFYVCDSQLGQFPDQTGSCSWPVRVWSSWLQIKIYISYLGWRSSWPCSSCWSISSTVSGESASFNYLHNLRVDISSENKSEMYKISTLGLMIKKISLFQYFYTVVGS